METRFYGAIADVEILAPSGQDLEDVHQAYTTMAASGILTEAQRNVFDTVSQRLPIEQDAEAIMLGGADLALAFDETTAQFPIIDCAGRTRDADLFRKVGLRPPPEGMRFADMDLDVYLAEFLILQRRILTGRCRPPIPAPTAVDRRIRGHQLPAFPGVGKQPADPDDPD